MGGEHHLDCPVDIAPFGMMVAFLSHQCRAGHESEGLVEILEGKGPRDRFAARRLRPAWKPLQGRFSRFCRQPLRHARLPVQTRPYPNTDPRLSGPAPGYGGGAASAAEFQRRTRPDAVEAWPTDASCWRALRKRCNAPDEATIFIPLRQRRTSAAMPPAAPRTNRALAASARSRMPQELPRRIRSRRRMESSTTPAARRRQSSFRGPARHRAA